MSDQRGSAGSTRHPATSGLRHLLSVQLGLCAGPTRDPAKRAHRVHELMDHALPEARNGPEKATPETGSVYLTLLVTPDANKSDPTLSRAAQARRSAKVDMKNVNNNTLGDQETSDDNGEARRTNATSNYRVARDT